MARQFQIEITDRRDLDVIVPQKLLPTHADKGGVSVDP